MCSQTNTSARTSPNLPFAAVYLGSRSGHLGASDIPKTQRLRQGSQVARPRWYDINVLDGGMWLCRYRTNPCGVMTRSGVVEAQV